MEYTTTPRCIPSCCQVGHHRLLSLPQTLPTSAPASATPPNLHTVQLPPFTKQYQRPPHNLSTPHQAVVQSHNHPWPSQQAQSLVEKHPVPVVPPHPATTHTHHAPRQRSGMQLSVCVLWQAPHLCCSSLTAIQQQQPMSLWRWWQHSCILNTIIHCHITSNNCSSSSRSTTVRSHRVCVTCVSKQPATRFQNTPNI